MTITYTLNKEDFLEHMLYTASKSNIIKKKRLRTKVLLPLLLIAAGGYFWVQQPEGYTGYAYFAAAILWYFLYPIYERGVYKRQYRKHIDAHYTNRIGIENQLRFEDDHLHAQNSTGSSQTHIEEFESLIEIRDHFFLKMKSELYLVIPKRDVTNHKAFIDKIQQCEIPYLLETNWEWK